MNVLVAEDDRATQARLVSYLTDWGHCPLAVADGKEAWEAFLEGDFRCVISDWMMPRMNGLELATALRFFAPGIRAVIMTGYGNAETGKKITELGKCQYMEKPFSMDTLLQLIAG